jgi:hypothetical protein
MACARALLALIGVMTVLAASNPVYWPVVLFLQSSGVRFPLSQFTMDGLGAALLLVAIGSGYRITPK